jgi:hypothetical protein
MMSDRTILDGCGYNGRTLDSGSGYKLKFDIGYMLTVVNWFRCSLFTLLL